MQGLQWLCAAQGKDGARTTRWQDQHTQATLPAASLSWLLHAWPLVERKDKGNEHRQLLVFLWRGWGALPSSWAVVKAEGSPSSSMTEQLRLGSHMVPTSAIPSVSQVVAPHRSCRTWGQGVRTSLGIVVPHPHPGTPWGDAGVRKPHPDLDQAADVFASGTRDALCVEHPPVPPATAFPTQVSSPATVSAQRSQIWLHS